MTTCKACGGSYEPVQTDGTQYFHACPPLNVREIREGLTRGAVVLSAVDAARLKAADELDVATPVDEGQTTRADSVLSALLIARPNARDENLASTLEKNKGAIKAA